MSTVAAQPAAPASDAPLFSGGATLLIALSFIAMGYLLQMTVMFVPLLVDVKRDPDKKMEAIAQEAATSSTPQSVGVIIASWLGIGILLGCVGLRTSHPADYLCLRPMGSWKTLGSLVAAMILALCVTIALKTYGSELPARRIHSAYAAIGSIPLFCIAMVLSAPIFEEILMRGFVYAGWRQSLGAVPTILLTSLVWTLAHQQYGLELGIVLFALGIVMGIAREFTGSLIAPIAMHVAINLVAVNAFTTQARALS